MYLRVLCLLVSAGLSLPTWAGDPLDQALGLTRDGHRELAASQSRVDQLDDEQQALSSEYARLQRRIAAQRDYLQRLRSRIGAQEQERLDLEAQQQELAVTREQLGPLLRRMVDTLAGVIAADLPFSREERRARQQRLQALLEQIEVSDSEKLRRVFEAYRIEVDYGYRLEAVRGPLGTESESDPSPREVEFIRLGRVALFYLSLDHREAGFWDHNKGHWQDLPGDTIPTLEQALRVAHKQASPGLLVLPLPVAVEKTL
jgi:hypothetical protein